jgi:nucleotide-binding universal stress UspA family protein
VQAVFERIVCGVDGSSAGFDALSQAIVLRAPDGELLALTALNIGQAAQAGFEASHAAHQLEEEADAVRSRAAEMIGDVASSNAETVRGRPVSVLLAEIESRTADLLAVGTHGTSRPAAIMFGSVASELLHRAPCSVLVARPATDGRVGPAQDRRGDRRVALVARRSGGRSHDR